LDLPTYTSIWRIEKRLYKLYDFRLPMPVPVGQIAVFAAITVPYVILLTVLGLPFNHTLFWLYVLPPGLITWLATRPVLESKRLPELVISQVRYLGEPATWCRMGPLTEHDQVVVFGKVWRRAEEPEPSLAPDPAAEPAPSAAPERPSAPVVAPALTWSGAATQRPVAAPARGVAAARKAVPAPAATPFRGQARPAPGPAAATARPAAFGQAAAPAPVRPTAPAPVRPTAPVRPRSAPAPIQPQSPPAPVRPPSAPAPIQPQSAPAPVRPPSAPGTQPGAGRRQMRVPEQVRAARQIWEQAQARSRPPAAEMKPASVGWPGLPAAARPARVGWPGSAATAQPAPDQGPASAPGDPGAREAPGPAAGALAATPARLAPVPVVPPASAGPAPAAPVPAAPAVVQAPARPPEVSHEDRHVTSHPATRPVATAELESGRPPRIEPPLAQLPPLPPAASLASADWVDRPPPLRTPLTAAEPAAERPAPGQALPATGVARALPQQPTAAASALAEARTVGREEPAADVAAGPGPAAEGGLPPDAALVPGAADAQAEAATVPGAVTTGGAAPDPGGGPEVPEGPQAATTPGDARAGTAPADAEAEAAPEDLQAEAAPEQPHPEAAPEHPQAEAAPEDAQAETLAEDTQAATETVPDMAAEGGPAPDSAAVPEAAVPEAAVPEAAVPEAAACAAAEGRTGNHAAAPDDVAKPGPDVAEAARPVAAEAGSAIAEAAGPAAVVGEVAQGGQPEPLQPEPLQPEPLQPEPLQPEPLQPLSAPPPAPAPAGPPVVVVRGGAHAQPIAVERAVGGPGQHRTVHSWREHVRVVPGGQGPGRPDRQRRDRERATAPIPGPRLIAVLGCTVGAGQTVTALMLADVLATLRAEPVGALDLNPGPASLASLAGTAPAATVGGLLGDARPAPAGSTAGPGRLDLIVPGPPAAGESISDQDYPRLAEALTGRYPLTLADPGPSAVARLLSVADQLMLVAPASSEASRAVAMTMEWLDAHGYARLCAGSITVINGVSRRSMPHVEQAELVVRGRCRAIVRVPWDEHLAGPQEGQRSRHQQAAGGQESRTGQLRPPAQHAYTALAGVLVGALAVGPGARDDEQRGASQ
jgi:MinD-like ATPase involved in chromosome partitioning or flagellar assembly